MKGKRKDRKGKKKREGNVKRGKEKGQREWETRK